MKIVATLAAIILASSALAQDTEDNTIYTDNTNTSDVTSNATSTTTVRSPPPSAISPSINSSNSDLCTVGVSGAVQTQILGISAGKTVRDMNCEKLKNAKTLYDMGMKVAAVSVMCQDERIFDAMMNAGTPCPYNGLIGDAARLGWENDVASQPTEKPRNGFLEGISDETKSTAAGAGGVALLLLLLL
jgi:hypothetical protein|tara:strand:+ start:529 stop:1092 length:564 start_codon:yes stop_codon:yes gene_type:complete